jgi:hypothetical protein
VRRWSGIPSQAQLSQALLEELQRLRAVRLEALGHQEHLLAALLEEGAEVDLP